jgi:hypothetical protein
MENENYCKKNKNLKPKIDKLKIIIMFSWTHISWIYISLEYMKKC